MTTKDDLTAIATCCRNSASMLLVADDHDPDKRRREACKEANNGQARLLFKAAEMAEKLAIDLA